MDATSNANNANNANSSSSTETNSKKRNNHRRRNNNNKKAEDGGKKARSSAANANAQQPSEEKGKQQEKKPLKGFKKNPKEDEEQENEDPDAEVCFICTRPIDYYAVAPCDHRTCHMCTLRLRVLYKTKNCAYCKAEAKKVVFTNDSEKPYEDYKRDDTPFYDKKYGIRFETQDMYNDTMVLLQYNCPEQDCEEAFESWNELKRHNTFLRCG
ncbi:hypothetical protein G6F42_021348 [Rhizopus arrhizus]|nr:hypothetical protein G6F42_021348 [Rhizopus arrhizus]